MSRVAARPRRRQGPNLRAAVGRLAIDLGIREPVVRVSGHPRMRERAAEVLNRRHRREQVITVSILILMVLSLSVWGALRSPLLWVERVSVVGVDQDVAARIEAIAGIAERQNVMDVDLDRVQSAIRALPDVSAASVRRILPSTIEIRVQQRKPVVAATHGDEVFLLDETGTVIAAASQAPAGVPVVELSYSLNVGLDASRTPPGAVALTASQMPAGVAAWVTSYRPGATEGEVDAVMVIPHGDRQVELLVHLGRPVDVPLKAQVVASLAAEVLAGPIQPSGFDVRIPDRPAVLTS